MLETLCPAEIKQGSASRPGRQIQIGRCPTFTQITVSSST